MPTYEYACKECGNHLEVVQRFTDDALTTCPSCGGALRKVFGNIGIAFKGSGFYKTDNRSGSSKGSSGSSGSTGAAASDAGSASSADGGSAKAADGGSSSSSGTTAAAS